MHGISLPLFKLAMFFDAYRHFLSNVWCNFDAARVKNRFIFLDQSNSVNQCDARIILIVLKNNPPMVTGRAKAGQAAAGQL